MIVHFAPCGTSVLANINRFGHRPEVHPVLSTAAVETDDEPEEALDGVEELYGNTVVNGQQVIDNLAELFRTERGKQKKPESQTGGQTDNFFSSEYEAIELSHKASANEEHRVVLLASDSNRGMRSAVITAALIARLLDQPGSVALWTRTRFAKAGKTPDSGERDALVHVVHIRHLKPDNHIELTQGLGNLLKVFPHCHDLGYYGQWELQLSGGYKSVGLYLISLSGLLARLANGGMTGVVRYESGKLIRVPLAPWNVEEVVEQAGIAEEDPGRVDGRWKPALIGDDEKPTVLCQLVLNRDLQQALGLSGP